MPVFVEEPVGLFDTEASIVATGTESVGTCSLCGGSFSKRQMLRHLSLCAYPDTKSIAAVVHLRVDVPRSPFWLDLDVKTNATMQHLDDFLRGIWLECCGHLSAFEIGRTQYVTMLSDSFWGREPDERSMSARISAALPAAGSTFAYEYDFGSTTELRLKVVAPHHAPSRRDAVRLLAINDPPVWQCNDCDEMATVLCSYCANEGDAFFCDAHADVHDCGEEAMLPVVNSPRMGVCGYTGDD
jgi:Plasmid pRiA4b ORF-3-like protein